MGLPVDIHPEEKRSSICFVREVVRTCSPTLFAPAIAGASIEMFNMLEESTELRDHLEEVTAYYRKLGRKWI